MPHYESYVLVQDDYKRGLNRVCRQFIHFYVNIEEINNNVKDGQHTQKFIIV